ncbi:MFS general substrate transporter, partial [Rhizodiscina lignyota]
NWSKWEKYSTFLPICFFSFLATANASNFAPAVVLLSKYFHKSNSTTTYLICFNTLMLGVGNLCWVPLMRKVGKRPVYLVALLLFVAFNAWSYVATSFESLLGARIMSAFAAAAADAPVPSVAADLFFVHERGFVLMFFQIALSFGFFIGPLINSYVIEDAGSWQWACGWLAIAAGVDFLVALLFVRETSYSRDTNANPLVTREKRGFLASMAVNVGFNPKASFFKSMLDIFIIATCPPVFWGGILVGIFVGWNIVIQLQSSVIFLAPPYLWKIHDLGLLALAGLIGTALAIFTGGYFIDIVANRMTRRNNGRRKPEYRLPAIILPAIIGPMGVLTFGLCIADRKPWIGAAFGYGMQGFGLTAVSNIMATYAIDCYHSFAGECLVFFFIVRSIIACILTLFTFNWAAATGI